MYSIPCLVCALSCVVTGSLFAEDVYVLNAGSSVSTLSHEQVKDLFLGVKTSWEDGSKVVVVVVKTGPSHEALMSRLGKNPQQFATGWKKLVFTGRGAMPDIVQTDAEAVELVAKTTGAVALVSKDAVKDGVKAIPAP